MLVILKQQFFKASQRVGKEGFFASGSLTSSPSGKMFAGVEKSAGGDRRQIPC